VIIASIFASNACSSIEFSNAIAPTGRTAVNNLYLRLITDANEMPTPTPIENENQERDLPINSHACPQIRCFRGIKRQSRHCGPKCATAGAVSRRDYASRRPHAMHTIVGNWISHGRGGVGRASVLTR
jgi:hypothetical protein